MLSGSPFAVDGTGILSPQQVGEISRLLGLYRPGPEGSSNITSAGTTPPMSDLLTYLKDLKPEYVALFSICVPIHSNVLLHFFLQKMTTDVKYYFNFYICPLFSIYTLQIQGTGCFRPQSFTRSSN